MSGRDTLDLTGLKCPLPALLTRRALAKAPADTIVTVLADDPLAHIDIPHMCAREGFTVIATVRDGSVVRLTLRR
jgi:tRNA 2-thiouridine synthesizing protein A